ncbi:MAG: hypothetical protein K6U10_00505 [Acidobacteriia bacterium]|nr:hypothetical protein [Methyloceanibacter sp.]MBX5471455.1 hypothetical protein [Acetobacteraceae bacterium]MCL6490284.1 hypothetical protein [Terriglobia bacterium]
MASKDWDSLSEDQQIMLSREALARAANTIAAQAELLAAEFDAGTLEDRGGAEALRLLAAVVRASSEQTFGVAGHA